MKDLTIEELKQVTPFISNGRWIAPAYYMSNGQLGGYIYESEEIAIKEHALFIKHKENSLARVKAIEEEENNARNEYNKMVASYGSFLSADPKKRGVQLKVLNTEVYFNDKTRTRREYLDYKISLGYSPKVQTKSGKDGFKLATDKKEFVLMNEESCYFVINKTEWEYAGWKINN